MQNSIHQRKLWTLWLGGVLCCCLPFFVKEIFFIPRLMLHNFTDGVFYMGYALHFSELVNRVGLNYYAVRFGGILPDALAFTLLGPELGLSVVRYTLSACCCLLLYVLFLRRTHVAYGLLAAIAWAFNPAAIRLLQTAYVDVAGTFLLCIGLVLLLLPKIKVPIALLAGILLAFAVSAHTHAIIALFFLLPLIVLVRKEDGAKRMFFLAGMTTLSAIFIFCAASGFYYWNYQ